jgi:hypothetical protein
MNVYGNPDFPRMIDTRDAKRVTVVTTETELIIMVEETPGEVEFFRVFPTGSCDEGEHGVRVAKIKWEGGR